MSAGATDSSATNKQTVEVFGPSSPVDDDSAATYLVQYRSAFGLQNGIAGLEDHGFTAEKVASVGFYVAEVEAHATQVHELRESPGVVAVEPNQTYTASTDQPNPPWGLDRVGQRALPLDSNYNYGPTGVGVKAYVIDTGLWLTHSEFAGRIPYGWDYDIANGMIDCAGHGTHVAGTLAGSTYGLAKSATVIPVRVLGCNGSSVGSSVVDGIAWVILDHLDGVPAVANLSLGGGASLVLDAAINAMIADGITVVVAAGNSARPSCNYSPARVPNAITVAASEIDDDDADYSNYGSCNDLFAPGSSILSAWMGSNSATNTISGTSMASPHVAGAAALILEATPSATPAQVWATMNAASTLGALSECCGDPDKLLYVAPDSSGPSPTTTTTTTTTTTVPEPEPDPVIPTYVSVSPVRLLDTRPGQLTIDGLSQGDGVRAAGSITQLQAAGRGSVPGDASAVVLNVAAVSPSEVGYVTVFPCNAGNAVPNSSNLNFAAGETIPNAVVVKAGLGGTVCFYTSAATQLVADINGYYPAGSTFVPLTPSRLLDSRPGPVTVDGQSQGIGVRPAGSITELQVSGRVGVPSDVSAVVLNVTVAAPSGGGYATVFPCTADIAVPKSSNLNFSTGQTIPNLVIAKIGLGGKVCIYTSTATHVVADINGYYPVTSSFVSLSPSRMLDSRPGLVTVDGQSQGIGLRPAGSLTVLQVTNRVGVPGDASTVVLNVTAVSATGPGFVTVFPCSSDGGVPNSSNLNFSAGQTIPNAVIVKVGDGGAVCLYTSAATHLVADINGFYPVAG